MKEFEGLCHGWDVKVKISFKKVDGSEKDCLINIGTRPNWQGGGRDLDSMIILGFDSCNYLDETSAIVSLWKKLTRNS